MSSFKGDDLFGSGPHRFVVGREGRRVVSFAGLTGDPTLEGSSEFGDLELRVEVRGRLVAGTESALWSLRDDIVAEAASTEGSGTLSDGNGRNWSDMKLLTFEPGGATDRGRDFSLMYTAEFGRLASG